MEEEKHQLSLLPSRRRGSYLNSFKSTNVVSNHFHVKIEDFEEIYIFSVHYNPKIPLDNVQLRRQLLENNRDRIKAYIGIHQFMQKAQFFAETTSTPGCRQK